MTQGDPLLPTIFNVVVYAVIRHWVTMAEVTKAGAEVLVVPTQDLEVYFYSDDVLVASTQLERLQVAFDVLTDLFERVGLRKNTNKMACMACQPCHTPVRMLVVAYDTWATGTVTTYWEHQRMWFQCLECGL